MNQLLTAIGLFALYLLLVMKNDQAFLAELIL